ncbi:TetR/AcrR family transcriptional regulator [Stackebrandtia albiflava]|uniref:TetR/AcrR family transcriptional regulator n=1 Tax=Stackebrandtia albiflava TaxID=406432 RepID=UPI0011BF1912|nr:TetR/AcrR family transcriptional regulator [Stackebrandtia albiflava]
MADTPAPIWSRPERAATGRPPEHSRDEIAAAATVIADREGVEAVSMRRVAAELGTGAATLYRYVVSRDELLDLMVDAAASGYRFAPPTGDWVADLLDVADQSRRIMRAHPWLPALTTRPLSPGPHGVALLEHAMAVLAGHPATASRKLSGFAVFNGAVAMLVRYELDDRPQDAARRGAYLRDAVAAGDRPHLAAVLAAADPADSADRFHDVLRGILHGLLGVAG